MVVVQLLVDCLNHRGFHDAPSFECTLEVLGQVGFFAEDNFDLGAILDPLRLQVLLDGPVLVSLVLDAFHQVEVEQFRV